MLDNLKSAFKSTLIYGLGNISIKLVGFALLPLYTKYLPVSDYGILGLLESISQILVTIFSFNLTSALFRWYWEPQFILKQKSIFFTSLIFCIIVGIVIFIGFFPLTTIASNLLFERNDLSRLLKLMVAFSALEIIINIPATIIRLQEKAALYSMTMVVRLMVNLCATVLLFLFVSKSVESIYLAQLMGSLVYCLILLPYISRNIQIAVEIRILKEMLSYSIPLVIGSLSVILVSFVDRYLLKYFGMLADVGVYALGYKMANIILFIVMSIQLALGPIMYKAINTPESKRFFSKIMTYLAFSIMFLVLAASIFGQETIKLMARNPEYWSAFYILPILSFGIFFGTLRDVAVTGLIVTRSTKSMAVIMTSMAILNVILDLVFIPHFQTIGAASANLLTQICYFLLYYIAAKRVFPIQYEISKLIKVIILGIVLVLVSVTTFELSIIMRVTLKTIILCSYPFLLYAMQFYDEIELIRLKEGWNTWKHPQQWKNLIRALK